MPAEVVTQIDFYILSGTSQQELLRFACRLTDKALQQNHRIFLNAESAPMAEQLDETLWTFRAGSFIPHRCLPAAPGSIAEPVVIGHDQEPPEDAWDVMINLAVDVPEFFSRYRRVAEVVDSDEQRLSQGRDRFRFYRERGYELRTHNP